MNDETHSVSLSEKHLHGVHGWLIFYILSSRFIAPLIGAGALLRDLSQIERDDPFFYASAEMVAFRSVNWAFLTGVTAYTWWFTERLRKDFVPDSIDLAVRSLIGIAVAKVAIMFLSLAGILGIRDVDVIVSNLAPVILGSGLFCAVWVSYFKLSKRVHNTYRTGQQPVLKRSTPTGESSKASSILTPTPAAASAPITSHVNTAGEHSARIVPASLDDDHFYAMALEELDGSSRNMGRWARLFAVAEGQESVARARYLLESAAEFKQQALTAAELAVMQVQNETRLTEAEELRLQLAKRGLLSESMVGRRKDHLMQGHLDGTFTVRHPSGLTQRFREEEDAIKWAHEG